jgi:hypothetical protein
MNYDWVYLCSDIEKLKLTLQTLGEEPYTDLRRMILIHCDQDLAFDVEARSLTHSWLDIEVRDITKEADALAAKLSPRFMDYYRNPRPRWALGVKMLLPMLFEPPFLYTDDDVLMPVDPHPLLIREFATAQPLDRLPWSITAMHMTDEISQIFGFEDFDITDYNGYKVDCGTFYITDRRDWWDKLNAWWESKFVHTLKARSNDFRLQDQRFLTAWVFKYGWKRLNASDDYRPYVRPFRITTPNIERCKCTHFIHYGAGLTKPEYMAHFRENWNV